MFAWLVQTDTYSLSSASAWAMFPWLVQTNTYSLSSATTWAMFPWLVQTDTYSLSSASAWAMFAWVGSQMHLLFEFGQHLGYVRIGWFRQTLTL